jgi:hypothetical protein
MIFSGDDDSNVDGSNLETESNSFDELLSFFDGHNADNDALEEFDQQFEFLQLKNYLDPDELKEMLTPSTKEWTDCDPASIRTIFKINEAREQHWKYGKDEAKKVIDRVITILNATDRDEVTLRKLIELIVGAQSEIGRIFIEEIGIDEKAYLEFMMTYCVQSGYQLSSTQIYEDALKGGILKDAVSMSESEYNKIWKTISQQDKLSAGSIDTGRRSDPLWKKMEDAANRITRKISIEDREGDISIARCLLHQNN